MRARFIPKPHLFELAVQLHTIVNSCRATGGAAAAAAAAAAAVGDDYWYKLVTKNSLASIKEKFDLYQKPTESLSLWKRAPLLVLKEGLMAQYGFNSNSVFNQRNAQLSELVARFDAVTTPFQIELNKYFEANLVQDFDAEEAGTFFVNSLGLLKALAQTGFHSDNEIFEIFSSHLATAINKYFSDLSEEQKIDRAGVLASINTEIAEIEKLQSKLKHAVGYGYVKKSLKDALRQAAEKSRVVKTAAVSTLAGKMRMLGDAAAEGAVLGARKLTAAAAAARKAEGGVKEAVDAAAAAAAAAGGAGSGAREVVALSRGLSELELGLESDASFSELCAQAKKVLESYQQAKQDSLECERVKEDLSSDLRRLEAKLQELSESLQGKLKDLYAATIIKFKSEEEAFQNRIKRLEGDLVYFRGELEKGEEELKKLLPLASTDKENVDAVNHGIAYYKSQCENIEKTLEEEKAELAHREIFLKAVVADSVTRKDLPDVEKLSADMAPLQDSISRLQELKKAFLLEIDSAELSIIEAAGKNLLAKAKLDELIEGLKTRVAEVFNLDPSYRDKQYLCFNKDEINAVVRSSIKSIALLVYTLRSHLISKQVFALWEPLINIIRCYLTESEYSTCTEKQYLLKEWSAQITALTKLFPGGLPAPLAAELCGLEASIPKRIDEDETALKARAEALVHAAAEMVAYAADGMAVAAPRLRGAAARAGVVAAAGMEVVQSRAQTAAAQAELTISAAVTPLAVAVAAMAPTPKPVVNLFVRRLFTRRESESASSDSVEKPPSEVLVSEGSSEVRRKITPAQAQALRKPPARAVPAPVPAPAPAPARAVPAPAPAPAPARAVPAPVPVPVPVRQARIDLLIHKIDKLKLSYRTCWAMIYGFFYHRKRDKFNFLNELSGTLRRSPSEKMSDILSRLYLQYNPNSILAGEYSHRVRDLLDQAIRDESGETASRSIPAGLR